MIGICYEFLETSKGQAKTTTAQQWYRLAENWSADLLIMVDKSDSAGQVWFDTLLPQQPVKIDTVRVTSIADAIFLHEDMEWVFVERLGVKPTLENQPARNLFTYRHPESAIYVFGSDQGAGLRGIRRPGHWVYVPSAGISFVTHVAAAVLYDRAFKATVSEKAWRVQTKEKELNAQLEDAAIRERDLRAKFNQLRASVF